MLCCELRKGHRRINSDAFKDIEKLETDLWEAADNLRANSKLTSSDYFMPVLGAIFLRHAANRFDAAHRQIEADQASGKMPKRRVLPADYIARRSLYVPATAQYDFIMQQAATSGADLPKLVTDAMTGIEAEFEPLLGVLPKDYGIFETKGNSWNSVPACSLIRRFRLSQVTLAQGGDAKATVSLVVDALDAHHQGAIDLGDRSKSGATEAEPEVAT